LKIRNDISKIPESSPVRAKPAAKPEEKTRPKSAPGDSVTLSDRSREAQRLKDLVEKVPDVRSERVAELRKAVQDGTYRVSGDKIAEKLLTELSPEKKS